MSFGLSPSDIITGIQSCRWFYNHCINISAHRKFVEFRHEIGRLGVILEQLHRIFESEVPSYKDLPSWKESKLRQKCSEIIGDYNRTLSECNNFVHDNLRLSERSNATQNVYWGITLQRKVDTLRGRILFHSRMIQQVFNIRQSDALARLEQNVSRLLEILDKLQDSQFPRPDVSPGQVTRPKEKSDEAPPQSLHGLSDTSREGGTDALSHTSDRSTHSCSQSGSIKESEEQLDTSIAPPDGFNIKNDMLVPWYASPSTTSSKGDSFNLEVRSGDETGKRKYEFPRLEDAWKFQQALLGYEVVQEWCNVHWTLNERWAPFNGLLKRGLPGGIARLQLWQWKPIAASRSDTRGGSDADQLDGTGATLSRTSTTTNSTIEDVTKGCDPSLFRLVGDIGANRKDYSTAIAAVIPPPPVLVMFTTFGDQWTILHMEVNENHEIAIKSRHHERESVIESGRASNTFPLRRLSAEFEADGEPNTDQWNLLVFGRPVGNEAQPQDSFLSLPKLVAKYLSLDFQTAEERQAFDQEFAELVSGRIERLAQLQHFSLKIQRASDHVSEPRRCRKASSESMPLPGSPPHERVPQGRHDSAYCSSNPDSRKASRAGTL